MPLRSSDQAQAGVQAWEGLGRTPDPPGVHIGLGQHKAAQHHHDEHDQRAQRIGHRQIAGHCAYGSEQADLHLTTPHSVGPHSYDSTMQHVEAKLAGARVQYSAVQLR